MVNAVIKFLVIKLKKYLDFLYYEKYHFNDEQKIVRTSFVSNLNFEKNFYKKLENYLLKSHPTEVSEFKEALLSFYHWEVYEIVERSKRNPEVLKDIDRYAWILIFCDTVEDYLNSLNSLTNNN